MSDVKRVICAWCAVLAMASCAGSDDIEATGVQASEVEARLPDGLAGDVDGGLSSDIDSGGDAGDASVFVAVPTGMSDEAPAVIARGSILQAYVRGLDERLYSSTWSSSTGWLEWAVEGGVFTSKPSATAIGAVGAAVVGRGADADFYVRVSLPAGDAGVSGLPPTEWLRLPGGPFKFAPAITFFRGQLLVFGVQYDNSLYLSRNNLTVSDAGTYSYSHANWSSWEWIGGVFRSEPAATVSTDGSTVYVAGRGRDRRFYFATSNDGVKYTEWAVVPGAVYSSGPALAARNGKMTLVGRGVDGAFWAATATTGSFSDPRRIGSERFDSSPAATVLGGDLYVFGTGLDERVYYTIDH